jgi:hypothetical protein
MKFAKVAVDAGICERLVAPAELDNDYSFHVIAGTLDDLLDAFGLRLDTRGDRSTARRRRASRGAGGCSRFFNVAQGRRRTSTAQPARSRSCRPRPQYPVRRRSGPGEPRHRGGGLIRVTSLDGTAEGQAEASIHRPPASEAVETRPTTGRLRSPAPSPARDVLSATQRLEPGTVERPAVEASCHQLEARRPPLGLRWRPGRADPLRQPAAGREGLAG